MYWDMSDYIGAGLGSSGFTNGVRYKNISDMKEYLAVFGDPAAAHSAHPDNCTGRERGNGNVYEKMYLPAYEYRVNTAFDNISEAVFTGLRRREGICWREALEVYLRADSAGRPFGDTGNAADDKHIRSAEAAADSRTDEECSRSVRNIFADTFREAYEYEQGGLLLIDERGMRLTERGIDISNGIMSLFV
jgi:oxygen-independent coproporphyrinogen-3 oxidase